MSSGVPCPVGVTVSGGRAVSGGTVSGGGLCQSGGNVLVKLCARYPAEAGVPREKTVAPAGVAHGFPGGR